MSQTLTAQTSSDRSLNGDRAMRMYRYDRVYQPLPHPDAIDEPAIRRFHEDGFIAVENVFTPAEVQSYLDAIHETILADDGTLGVTHYEPGVDGQSLPGPQRVPLVRKLFLFADKVPVLGAAAGHPRLFSIAQRLMGEQLVLSQDMALLKPPGGGVEKPWHQDTAYFAISPPTAVIGTWTALDEATLDNGCMHAIPGSHKLGPKPHYHDRDCQLPDDTVDLDRDVAIPLKPGGTMFFSGLLHHGTPPNRSQSRRQALQFHYRTVSSTNMRPEELIEAFQDGAGFAGCQGWKIKMKTRDIDDRADFPADKRAAGR